MVKPRFFRSQHEFRTWLEKHHAEAREIWVGYHKKGSARKGITYREALDEALCFGWIDGKARTIDDERYMQRYSPRTAKSPWSEINIARVRELKRMGAMTAAGLAAFERRDRSPAGPSDEEAAKAFAGASARRFRRSRAAWAFFQAQPPGYRRNAIRWVMSAKREETRQRRLARLIEDSAEGRRLPQLG